MKTEIRYKTFDELLSEVMLDLPTLANEGMIEPGQLIKVAQRVNYDLGLRIHGTKERMLDIEARKVRLPSDFYVLNHAVLCTSYSSSFQLPAGRHTEDVIVKGCKKCGQPDPECSCEATYAVECQNGEKIFVQVVEKRKTETRVWDSFHPITIGGPGSTTDILRRHDRAGYIKNGFLYTNVDSGNLYLNYQGALEDEAGNLLVLDHPYVNEYYEYALKQRLLENLFMAGEDVSQKIQLVEGRLRAARNNALSVVNTPDFAEMKQLWEINRKAQYNKYYDMFKSYPSIHRYTHESQHNHQHRNL